MSAIRRLAAILAADIAGYSRLMGADEEGTLATLKAIRRELVDPKIEEHRGRIVKTTGDGLLVEFASVVDAVRCAVEIQRVMAERKRRCADGQADRVSHRHQPRRRDPRRGRHLRRRRQPRRPSRSARRARRNLRQPGGARPGPRQARHLLRGRGRAASQEHRQAGARLPHPDRWAYLGAGAAERSHRFRAPPSRGRNGRACRHFRRAAARARGTCGAHSSRPARGTVGSSCSPARPGIGKTRTAQELAGHAAQREAAVLWGRCHEESGAPPYWPWVQIIRAALREAEPDLLAGLGRRGERHCRHRAGDPRSAAGVGAVGPARRSVRGPLSHVRIDSAASRELFPAPNPADRAR